MSFSGYQDLEPEFAWRLKRFCDATGCTPANGYRSSGEQQHWFDCRQNFVATGHCACTSCNTANRPGSSWHEFRLACDVEANGGDFHHERLAEFDLVAPISGEPWHLQPDDITASAHTPGAAIPALRSTRPTRRSDDDMGVYVDHSDNGKPFSVPLVPAGAGASGGGYGPVYVSLSAADEVKVTTKLVGDGKVWSERSNIIGGTEPGTTTPRGRWLVDVCNRVDGKSPSALIVTPDRAARVDYLVEWERPEI